MVEHFSSICKKQLFSIQIIEKLPGSGYTASGSTDENKLKIRLEKEDNWMKTLRTIYPYGLNEKAKNKEKTVSSRETPIGTLFPQLPRPTIRPVRSRGNRNNKESFISIEDFMQKLDCSIKTNPKGTSNYIRLLLNKTKKNVLKDIAFQIMECTSVEHRQVYDYVLDIIDTKLYKPSSNTCLRKTPKNVCVINFDNKGMDDLHLSKIFNSYEVTCHLPGNLKVEEGDIPVVTYKLGPPIRNKIFNYKETVQSISVDDEVSLNNNSTLCDCSDSQFCDPNHHHIVTGDLRIIENSKLRKLLTKGPNFREQKTVNYSKCLKSVKFAIEECIGKMSVKYRVDMAEFSAWKQAILDKISCNINKLKSHKVIEQTKPVLQDPEVLTYLQELQRRYVIVPIDKASNNFAFVCKHFYVARLLDEIGIPGGTSQTYKLASLEKSTIIENNIFLSENFGLTLGDKEKDLPIMYWMPKMHKTPSGARFIVASSVCSTKPLSKAVSSVFKLIFDQIEHFHDKSYFYKNYNRFWVVQNSKPIIDKFDKINLKRGAKDISTFDFSTLYTKLQHNDLVTVLNKIIDFVFLGGKHKYIRFTSTKAFWASYKKGKSFFTKSNLKTVVEHLITASYFHVGNLLLLQTIGIPMGIDPAPFWANLYLYHYEYKFITTQMQTNKSCALRFRHASRFIDDMCCLNDCGEFGRSYHLIYPAELELKCEHSGNYASFLDLDINIIDGQFIYKLFDKRDTFPFFIVRMPHLSANIPSFIFYGSIMSEFLRIARTTLKICDFISRAGLLYGRMLSQGGKDVRVLQQLKKAISRHPLGFEKYHKTQADITNSVLRFHTSDIT